MWFQFNWAHRWRAGVSIFLMFGCSTVPLHAGQDGSFSYTENGGSIRLTDYPENAVGHVVIPVEIDGLPVTEIGAETFHACSLVTGVTIPSSVTAIGRSAFSSCHALVELEIPSGVNSIGDWAFYDCIHLTSINVPSGISALADHTCWRCFELVDVEL